MLGLALDSSTSSIQYTDYQGCMQKMIIDDPVRSFVFMGATNLLQHHYLCPENAQNNTEEV